MVPAAFHHACHERAIQVSSQELELLQAYLDRLLDVNTRMNLTAIRDEETAWMRHVFDSLTMLEAIKSDSDQRVVDIGSGGGLPAIPLAIMRPDLRFTLVESTGKKARFLEETASDLGLKHVEIRAERAETLGRDPDYRASFHVATARAVAALPVLLELTAPLLKVGGQLLAMKGRKAQEEIKKSRRVLELLHMRILRKEELDEDSILVRVKKDAATGKRYPRPPGTPAKTPL